MEIRSPSVTTSLPVKIKNIILVHGKKDCRLKTSNYFLKTLKDNSETLQFGFFLKTYAAIITNIDEQVITENKYDILEFQTEGILLKIHNCINDTNTRLNYPQIQYNKMGLLAIFNYLFDTTFRLEHEIPKDMNFNIYRLLRQIGEIWKLVFTNTIWTDLVITAINRSPHQYIIVDDFRFPEEYVGLVNGQIHQVDSIKIIDSVLPPEKKEGYHVSEFALEDFPFDYLINCTIPSNLVATNYVESQVQAISEYILYKMDNTESGESMNDVTD